jgi:hypothetical protein
LIKTQFFDARGHELTLVELIDRCAGLSLSHGERAGVDSYSLGCDYIASLLLGRREMGFVTNPFL